MEKYEYHVECLGGEPDDLDETSARLSELGREGWRVVSATFNCLPELPPSAEGGPVRYEYWEVLMERPVAKVTA